MSEYVLDTSALLTILFGEAGSERVLEWLSDAAISTANLSEVIAKLKEKGVSPLGISLLYIRGA